MALALEKIVLNIYILRTYKVALCQKCGRGRLGGKRKAGRPKIGIILKLQKKVVRLLSIPGYRENCCPIFIKLHIMIAIIVCAP